MFDETNNAEAQELSLPDKLFESDGSEGVGKPVENDNGSSNDTITIKYNGEERDITLDEARILAQKGMNYDHVVAERDTKYKRELDFLDRMAREKGMTRAEYLNSQEISPATEETNGSSEVRERARAQIQRITDSVGFTGPWSALFNTYPSLSRREAFDSLTERVRQGLTPLEAYQEKLILDKENELRMVRENNFARAKSVGALDGDEGPGDHDEFLEGFFSVL